MFINLFENINNLQTVANSLRVSAGALMSTGNNQLSEKLYLLADNIVKEINVLSKKMDENNTEDSLVSWQSSQNVLNAALAGIEVASKQNKLPEDHSNFCEQFNSNCACLNCWPENFCVEDPCHNCDGPTAIMCEPPDIEEKPLLKMKACMVCKTLLYFPLDKCPECKRDTITVLIES